MNIPEISEQDLKCVICRIALRKVNGHGRIRIINDELDVRKYQLLGNQEVVVGSRVCPKCWLKLLTKERQMKKLESTRADQTDADCVANCTSDK